MSEATELYARYGHSMTLALKRIAELEAGGCARDQKTTQYCAEVVERDRRIAKLEQANSNLRVGNDHLFECVERMELALEQIDNWAKAYPLDVFPDPDFAKAHELLQAGGMTLDAISASNMRHVVEGVGEIARKALETGK